MSATVQDDRTEQAMWQDLTGSDGWSRLVAHVKAEWDGPAFVRQVEQLADNPQDEAALSKLRQLLAAKRAVLRVLAVPDEMLSRVKRDADIGPMVDAMSRRGRL
jgi:hypothetical protein